MPSREGITTATYLLTYLYELLLSGLTVERLWCAEEQFVVNTEFEISFDFRTVEQTGVIITTTNTYSGISVEMYEGEVRLSS